MSSAEYPSPPRFSLFHHLKSAQFHPGIRISLALATSDSIVFAFVHSDTLSRHTSVYSHRRPLPVVSSTLAAARAAVIAE